MHADVQEKVTELVERLKDEYRDDLLSVCVYGSAVFLNQPVTVRNKHQDINVLVILGRMDLDILERATGICRWWQKAGQSIPIMLSEAEWSHSQDIFAMEYADIRDNHHVAYGKDYYSNIEVDPKALRLVVELEIHRKLIFLREKFMHLPPRLLLDLLQDAVTTLAALFRGVLRLVQADEVPPMRASEVFEKTAKLNLVGYDPKPFLKVLEIKNSGYIPRDDEVLELFESFIKQLSVIREYVDRSHHAVENMEKARV